MPRLLLLLALLLSVSYTVSAQEGAGYAGGVASAPDGPVSFQAIRTATPPTVDGRLDDPSWNDAPVISGFKQREPQEGAMATEQTEVRILYDDTALYVAARMHDSAPDSITARLGRRDNAPMSDLFGIALDPYHDRRSGYYFAVNAAGTLFDGVLVNDGGDDDAWDGVWTGRVEHDEHGWTAEMQIPYSQLRFRPDDVQVWGFNLRRFIARKQENTLLKVVPSTESGFVSHFPDLVGIENIRPSRGFEVVPYLTSRSSFTNPADGNPFDDGSSLNADVGADFKVGLTSNLTLNATINPDFGQVEVDPAVVNLSAFETFFPEKRPFFVEGASIFNFGSGGSGRTMGFNWVGLDPFYSRRIGRSPGGALPGADYANTPETTRILGAGKLTGRLGGTNIGVVSSLTGRSDAQLFTDGVHSDVEIEPLAHYGVVRGLREFQDGERGLGLLATATNRSIETDLQRDYFNSEAYTAGVDGWTRFGGGRWALKGWASMSHVAGSQERISRLQRASTHYLQRPDREAYRFDPSRTSLTGFAGRLMVDKIQGNWMVNSSLGIVSPTYDLNDVGFLGRTDLINSHLFVGHYTNQPGRVFRNRTLMAAVFGTANFDGDRTGTGMWGRTNFELLNYWSFNGGFFAGLGSYDQFSTRGGPIMWSPAGANINGWLNTDGRKAIQFGMGGNINLGEEGNGYGGDLDVTIQPASNVNISFGPGLYHGMSNSQYVTTLEDPLATETFGQRYVFAELDQWQVSANLRVNWTFSPTMSLQMFAQPLLATGAYDGYKELARPRTYDFNTYTVLGQNENEVTLDPDGAGEAEAITLGRPDFRFASLRGNAVFRWEYRPGSTLFLVWTQQREDFSNDGTFAFGQASRGLIDAQPDNVFALKLTYWLGR